jgi:hypothetical protein
MNYLSKYLKYKSKYLFLKHQIGGSNSANLESFIKSKGINNLTDLIPNELSDMVNKLLADTNPFYKNNKQNNLTWLALIFFNKNMFSEDNSLLKQIITYFDTVPKVASAVGAIAIEPMVTKAAGGVAEEEPLVTKAAGAIAIEPLVTKAAGAIAIEPLVTKAAGGVAEEEALVTKAAGGVSVAATTTATAATAATTATAATSATATSAATGATAATSATATVATTDTASFSAIPEIIIPSEEFNYDDRDYNIFNLDNFDLSEMTASDDARTGTDKIREYAFKMTALLFDKAINGYTLSALHYTSDDSDRENIIKILTKYYTKELEYYTKDYLPERIDPYREKLRQVSLPTFLTTNKYMRVGCLKFGILNKSTFYIDHIDAWIMEKGSGLQMICSLLKIFLPTFTTIMLTAATGDAVKYWESLGFTVSSGQDSSGRDLINTNIRETILSKCSPLAPNVKLILKLNDVYTNDLEAVKHELVS